MLSFDLPVGVVPAVHQHSVEESNPVGLPSSATVPTQPSLPSFFSFRSFSVSLFFSSSLDLLLIRDEYLI